MAKYLRDRQVKNLSITTTRIRELFDLCEARADQLVASGMNASDILVKCMIRFDEKGYMCFAVDDVLRHYESAHDVERIVFSIETTQSITTNRSIGTFMEVMLDKKIVLAYLIVSSDDQGWVDATFSGFQDVIVKSAAWYWWVRTVWTELVVQVAGVAAVFLLSLYMAKQLAPKLAVENAFLIAFLLCFLLTANVWNFLQRQVHAGISAVFANVQFVQPGKEHRHWLFQMVVSAIAGLVIAWALGQTGLALTGAASSLFVH